jgi:hypothetical protein
MRHTTVASLFVAAIALTGSCRAQAQDVGLWMSGGFLTVIWGQDCGPVGCAPLFGSFVGRGETRSLTHLSAPQSLYAVAIGFPGPCLAIPGIDNALLLGSPVILGAGVTTSPPFVPTPCQQGLASESFTIPPNAPAGVVFRVQSFGLSNSGVWAFGPAIEATTV